jgi:peptide deformylase
MKVNDILTHVDNAEDLPFLKSKLFDVNMRLFSTSFSYRRMIKTCCELIKEAALIPFEDYKKPHGMSGANVGIPFNIIGIVRNRGKNSEYCQIMINPKILRKYGDLAECESNCGSIRLKKPIKVKRSDLIDLMWFRESGQKEIESAIGPSEQSFTIQHEVDHNLGILITDL